MFMSSAAFRRRPRCLSCQAWTFQSGGVKWQFSLISRSPSRKANLTFGGLFGDFKSVKLSYVIYTYDLDMILGSQFIQFIPSFFLWKMNEWIDVLGRKHANSWPNSLNCDYHSMKKIVFFFFSKIFLVTLNCCSLFHLMPVDLCKCSTAGLQPV